MAPLALILMATTLTATHFAQGLPDTSPGHNEHLDLTLTKEKLKNDETSQRFSVNNRIGQLSPEVPPLYKPEVSKTGDDSLFDVGPAGNGAVTMDRFWTPWTDWSLCSRSCGGGVAVRSRRCENRLPGACEGPKIEYMLCNTKACPGSSLSFRELQCSQRSRKLFHLPKYNWVPYSSNGVYACGLSCMAEDHHFVQSFGTALDGTRCGKDGKDMCIAGECVKIGCDMIVDSTMSEDACGVCGGDNGTCFHFMNVVEQLQPNAEYFKYNEIARIPVGATHIFVQELGKNFLSLMEADEHFEQYIVNGNRVVSWPGVFETAGTTVRYRRVNDAEMFEIEGPTTKDLYIMILYLGQQLRIEYEYWIPNSLRPSQLQSHSYYDYYPEYDPLDYGLVEPLATPESTASTTTTSTTTTTAPSTTTTVTTTTTTESPKSEAGGQAKQVRTSIPVAVVGQKASKCKSCKRSRNRKKQYCESDFAIHARIVSRRRFRRGRHVRYDVEVVTTYKSDFKLMHREYVWVPGPCCPKLRPLRSYLLMGRKVRVDVTNDARKKRKGHHATIVRRYETRLTVGNADYWTRWKKPYEQNMAKIANKLNCEKYMMRHSKKEKKHKKNPEKASK